MLTTATGSGRPILSPEQVGELLVVPLRDMATCLSVATVVQVTGSAYRVPTITEDPSAAWVNEGEEIAPSDATLAETVITFSKVAGLTVASNELIQDASGDAAEMIGQGLARDIAAQLDAAFFGALPAPAPSGLGALAGITTTTAGTAVTSTDPFAEAQSKAEAVGARVTGWVTSPATALALAKVKKATGSNEPLMQPDPTLPTRRQVLGIPLLVSTAVAPGTIWALDATRTIVALRSPAQGDVEADSSPYFSSDRTAVRARLRVGFGFTHAAAVGKITTSA